MKKNRVIFIIALIILCLITAYSFSKYVIQITELHVQTPKEFYFKSNILTTDNKIYELHDWDGESQYSLYLDLQNYDDELKITNDDIKYNFSAVSKTEGINITLSGETDGTLIGNSKAQKQIDIKINPSKVIKTGEYAEIELTAKSTSPYEKELKATIKIYSEDLVAYDVNLENLDNEDYANLYISTKNINEQLNITYDNTKVILDTNNNLLQNTSITTSGNKSKISLTLEKNSSYCIGFIKKDLNYNLVLNTDISVSK